MTPAAIGQFGCRAVILVFGVLVLPFGSACFMVKTHGRVPSENHKAAQLPIPGNEASSTSLEREKFVLKAGGNTHYGGEDS